MAHDLNDIKQQILSDEYAAFRELYLLMYAPLMRFAAIYTHSEQMAEDVLSDVFLKLWERRALLQEVQNLRVYLYTAIKNTALNLRNRQAAFAGDEQTLSELPSTGPDPENMLLSAEALKNIQHTINQLPPRCKLIFQLAKEEGMRYKEISDILGISVKTIDNQLAIALGKIGSRLPEYSRKSV
jgi:RNA polymerase sigma-70 factor (ECF subfamily)